MIIRALVAVAGYKRAGTVSGETLYLETWGLVSSCLWGLVFFGNFKLGVLKKLGLVSGVCLNIYGSTSAHTRAQRAPQYNRCGEFNLETSNQNGFSYITL